MCRRWIVVAVVVATASCSGSIAVFTPPPDETYDPALVPAGKDIHLRTCATCHGREGGGGTGPNVRQVWERLNPAEHLDVVVVGREKMPAFGRSLSEEDIAAVVAYQRFGWSDPPS